MLVFPEPLLPIRRTFKKNSQDVTCTMMSQSQDFPISSIYRCKYLIIKIHKISEKYLLLHLDVLFHQFWLKTFRNYVNSRDSQTAWVLARKSCEDVRGCEEPAISLGQQNCVGKLYFMFAKLSFILNARHWAPFKTKMATDRMMKQHWILTFVWKMGKSEVEKAPSAPKTKREKIYSPTKVL